MKTYRYSSYRQMSPWEATQAWAAKRKAMREDFELRQSTAMSAFSDAATNLASGMATIAAQVSLDRIQAEAKQKQAAAANQTNYDTDPTPPTINVPSSTTLDGGSSLDLKANTITLSNGTTIDISTGLKKVNVTA